MGHMQSSSVDAVSTADSDSSTSPIATIPPELLADIFSLVARDNPPQWRSPPATKRGKKPTSNVKHRKDDLGWTAGIPGVCRLWRDVALSSACLWDRVDFRFADAWIASTLARAKATPLSMVFGQERAMSAQHVALLAAHLPHTRTLHLEQEVVDPDMFLDFRRALATPAPLLESVAVLVTSALPTSRLERYLPQAPFGATPRLQSLALQGIALSWATLPQSLSGLVRLELRKTLYFAPSRPTLKCLLDVLKRMPALENLLLEGPDAFPEARAGHSPESRSVALPLKTLFLLSGQVDDITLVLQSLVVPASTVLHLEIVRSHEGDDVQDLVHVLAAHILQTVDEQVPLKVRCSLMKYSSGLLFRADMGDTCPMLIESHLPMAAQSMLLRGLMQAYAAHRVEALDLSTDGPLDACVEMLAPLQRLRTLSVSGRALIAQVCAALALFRPPASTSGWKNVFTLPEHKMFAAAERAFILPALAELTVDGLNLSDTLTRPPCEVFAAYDYLPRLNAARQVCGAGMQTLCLVHCTQVKGWEDDLRKGFPVVETSQCH
ncbi:hypothetical protein FA95DRAFT_1609402 [Auriscalpium vulgare]|uniref:Uncharacterized protein n=1 Tax=Auriscalpium vulgare TaxID=40419 RepID=A0ACB8RHL2_9AGAM|nr:hypothetical protein FA95DRAFT_1609402 [Auriscalpium vulgare]